MRPFCINVGRTDRNSSAIIFPLQTWIILSVSTEIKLWGGSWVSALMSFCPQPPEPWERCSSEYCRGWWHLVYDLLFLTSSSGGAFTNKPLDDFRNGRGYIICFRAVLSCALLQTRHSSKTFSRCVCFSSTFSKYSPEATSMSYFLVAGILKYSRSTASQTGAACLSESDWKGNCCLEKKIGQAVNTPVECQCCQASQHVYNYVYDAICSCMVFISTITWMHDPHRVQLLTFARKKQEVSQGSQITLCIIPGLKIGKHKWIETAFWVWNPCILLNIEKN